MICGPSLIAISTTPAWPASRLTDPSPRSTMQPSSRPRWPSLCGIPGCRETRPSPGGIRGRGTGRRRGRHRADRLLRDLPAEAEPARLRRREHRQRHRGRGDPREGAGVQAGGRGLDREEPPGPRAVTDRLVFVLVVTMRIVGDPHLRRGLPVQTGAAGARGEGPDPFVSAATGVAPSRPCAALASSPRPGGRRPPAGSAPGPLAVIPPVPRPDRRHGARPGPGRPFRSLRRPDRRRRAVPWISCLAAPLAACPIPRPPHTNRPYRGSTSAGRPAACCNASEAARQSSSRPAIARGLSMEGTQESRGPTSSK